MIFLQTRFIDCKKRKSAMLIVNLVEVLRVCPSSACAYPSGATFKSTTWIVSGLTHKDLTWLKSLSEEKTEKMEKV
jgi:hypothetical protein